jgi:hypothetical protein
MVQIPWLPLKKRGAYSLWIASSKGPTKNDVIVYEF